MKINIDEAIELLQDYIKIDREIREGDTEIRIRNTYKRLSITKKAN